MTPPSPPPPATWTGKTALITGAGIRIGSVIVRTLSALGMNVVLHYRSSAAEAKALAADLTKTGGKANAVQSNLASEADCRILFQNAVDAFGAVDVLVNNASAFNKHPVTDMTETDILGEFWPNLFAPMLLTRFFAGQHHPGVVVNLLDRRIQSNDPLCIPYLLSKKGLADFTLAAAVALAPDIRVFGVAPGPILPPPGQDLAYLKERAGRVPLETLPTPQDIADAVVAALHLRASTGQILYVDGGQHLLGNGVA